MLDAKHKESRVLEMVTSTLPFEQKHASDQVSRTTWMQVQFECEGA
jgi:hypothetical protein